MTTMKGAKIHAKTRRVGAVAIAMPSARRIAHIFGACSPMVMWSMVITAKAIAMDTMGSQLAPAMLRPAAPAAAMIRTETAGSPRAPRIRLASVMPSWQADR